MEPIVIKSVDELPEVASRILASLAGRSVVAFYGPMGAGKTSLIKEICKALEVADTVTSPTFALVNQYTAGNGSLVNHFDFYRINRIEEAFDLGYEEYFYGGGLCLVEWPEKIENLLPEDTMTVCIATDLEKENKRLITIG